MYKKTRISVSIAVLIILLLGIVAIIKNYIHIYGEEYEIDAMCHAEGGIYKNCIFCSKEVCVSKTPPTGHKGVWITREEPTTATFGERELRCSVCKQQIDLIKLPPSTTIFSSIYIAGSGAGMTEKNDVTVSFKYNDTVTNIETEGRTDIRLMNAAVDYNIKHSYVLSRFNNDQEDTKPFGNYKDLSELYLFALKDDYTRSRSIVSDTQWIDIVADAHPEYYSFLKSSDDVVYKGENVLFYLNANGRDYVYAGAFTKRLPYGEFAKNFNDGRVKSVIKQTVYGENSSFVSCFGDGEEYEKNLDSLKQFLSINDASIADRTDLELLIDYCAYTLLTCDYNAYTSLYWITPDGYKWYPLMYDNQFVYGMRPNTDILTSYDYISEIPGIWKTVFSLYHEKISENAVDFAQGRLSVNNVVNDFERIASKLTDDVYQAEAKAYKIPYTSPASEIERITDWYNNRIDFITKLRTEGDAYFE